MPERKCARRARRDAWSRFVRPCAAVLLASAAAHADVAAPGVVATLRWTPAPGPVSGYQVFVGRDGGALIDAGLAAANQATLSGRPGEVVEVAVRAWGLPNGPNAPFEWGPLSEISERIRFDGPPVLKEAYPLLDCGSCMRFEIRDLAGETLLAVPHPTPGSWELVGIGELVRGSLQALLRERATGALWIGTLSGAGLVPLTSQVAPDFAASTVARPVDMDGDGAAEIVMHNGSSGLVQIWGLADGALVKRAAWLSPAGWSLIGVGDLDADRYPDIWLDTHHDMVWVDRVVDFSRVGSTVLTVPVADSAGVDVADYDGDSLSDVLWRDQAGAMRISVLRGDLAAPRVEVRALASQPGDANVWPRYSLDLDGRGGAEILLQDAVSGAVEVALPADAIPGRRQRLFDLDPLWRLVGLD